MFSKLAYSTLALTVSLGTVMSCQAEVTGTSFTAAFDHPQQINAGDLNVGYVDIGPKDGQPVILLHGWPYDIHGVRLENGNYPTLRLFFVQCGVDCA